MTSSTKQSGDRRSAEERDALHQRLAEETAANDAMPAVLRHMAQDPRITVRRAGAPDPHGRTVVYWMQRAQRGMDNHALDAAVNIANALGLPCIAYFAAVKNFPHANLRHYAFMNQGLPDVEDDCEARGIGFVMRRSPHESPERFFAEANAAIVIGDENPLRGPERWRGDITKKLRVPFWTVDADVVVPSKLLGKAQFSAGVMRPRLTRMMPEFLRAYENPHADVKWKRSHRLRAEDPRADITRGWKDLDRSVLPVEAWKGGRNEAMKRLKHFTADLLKGYDRNRNRPELDGTSKLSPYLHFGNLSPLTIALTLKQAAARNPSLKQGVESFLDESITWRELSVNFVRYQPIYDSLECADNWARLTIKKHDEDEREVLYTLKQLEGARTHDELWNAAQLQMLQQGWMHNSMRMYWAKKILEWTPDARTAMKWAIYLNDRYFLDGRDPNGYAGVAWAILGKFDRAWGELPIFGKRRYMSRQSTARKFDAESYIAQMRQSAR